jgi:hypothetical protein
MRPGFQTGSGHVGFVLDKVTLKQGFSQILHFPLPGIPPITPHSSPSSGASITDYSVASVIVMVVIVIIKIKLDVHSYK